MIPVYDAIEFMGVMTGGSTNPWQVLVDVNGSAVPYVIKLYDKKYQEHDIVMKEIIAAILANQFEIGKTEPALVNITKRFVNTLKLPEIAQLNRAGYRTKYATKLIEPAFLYSSSKTNILDKIDKANIYAFDNLILHRDRRFQKPNLLVNDSNYYLIDNENCFGFPVKAKVDLECNSVMQNIYFGHLFNGELKKIKDKSHLFDTFEYYLSNKMNLRELDFIPSFLDELRHHHGSFFEVYNYLKSAKLLSSRFVNHLIASVQ